MRIPPSPPFSKGGTSPVPAQAELDFTTTPPFEKGGPGGISAHQGARMTAAWMENLELLAEAPDGIKKLRELILELAVRGKLVPQDPSDEPASELLKRIAAEKARLVKEGKIKKQKPLAEIGEEEKPFELPAGWEWGRLGSLTTKITDGTHHSPTNTPNGEYRYISAKNIKPWGIDLSGMTYVTADVHREIYSRCDPAKGDVLYIKDGATTGVAAINSLDEPFSMLSSVALLKTSVGLSNEYLLKAMTAHFFYQEMRAGMAGVAITRVTLAKLNNAIIPLPPLAEQHRIVAKVDELMALCDRLEARQADAQRAHARLVQALLDSLTQAQDAEDFQAAWERVAGCFEGVFSTEESVTALANAMRRTIFSGRTSKNLEKWQPVNLKDVTCFLNGYAFKSEWFTQQGIKLARNINISHGNINWADTAHIDFDRAEEFKNFSLQAGDILLSLDRPIISTGLKMAVVSEQDLPCMLLQRVAKITPAASKITADFLLHWLRSPFFIEAIDPGRSNGVPHISTKQVGNLELLLPPLEEQHRIAAKVTELLALCDQLKAGIVAARAKQAQLAEALVKQAVATAAG